MGNLISGNPIISFMDLYRCLYYGTEILIHCVNEDWDYSGEVKDCYEELFNFGHSANHLIVLANSVYLNNIDNRLEMDCYSILED